MKRPKTMELRVLAALDRSFAQHGRMTVDKARGLVAVRPSRGREYVLTAAEVAQLVVHRVVKLEASK